MDFSSISLFKLVGSRLDYLSERQRLIASNVVNANTPEYKTRDLAAFEQVMSGKQSVALGRTSAGHLTGSRSVVTAGSARQPNVWEIAPNGNSVSLEQEMIKGSETADAFALTTGVFQRNVQLLRAAWNGNS